MIAPDHRGTSASRTRDAQQAAARRTTLAGLARDDADRGPEARARRSPRDALWADRDFGPALDEALWADSDFWPALDEALAGSDLSPVPDAGAAQSRGDLPGAREPSVTLADVIRRFGPEYRRRHAHTITVQQDRVLRELAACYTPLMGLHQWTCQHCGTVVELPNSCNNRHCPTCGETKRRRWAETTASRLLPIEYYHVILTVPQQITQLALRYPDVLYGLMLKTGAETLLRCGRELFEVELALLSLLHTWGSVLNGHVHSHNLLPAGGLRRGALEWIPLSSQQIEKLLRRVATEFPQRFLAALRQAYDEGQLAPDPQRPSLASREAFDQWLASFHTTRWIIRCPQVWDRRGAANDRQAAHKTVKYLANYANRVALSNDRVEAIDGEDVLLRYKDYRDAGRWKTKRIPGVAFLGHFLQHLLPRGMHHIRRYGWMARHVHNEKLQWLREHFHVADSTDAPSPEAEHDEAEPADEVPSRPCRYCQGSGPGDAATGTMVLTGQTRRPKVSDILQMPLSCFQAARAGALVTLGPHVAPAPSPGAPPRVPSGVPSRVLATSAVTPGEARGP